MTEKRIPVVETFGPTIQGEGSLAGLPTYFLRLGLCDYRCSWCDSLHAVLPKLVKANSERLTLEETAVRLLDLPRAADWVTISGGNPAVHELGPLVSRLQEAGMLVTVETQGSLWKPWLATLDHLTVSPKPPSSGMVSVEHTAETASFLDLAEETMDTADRSMKIVVFDEDDYQWARGLLLTRPHWESFISVGTDRPPDEGEPHEDVLVGIADRYRWLCEKVALDPAMRQTRVLPQLHVLAWSHALGV